MLLNVQLFFSLYEKIISLAYQEVFGKEVFNSKVKNEVAEAYSYLADVFIATEDDIRKKRESLKGNWKGFKKLLLKRKVEETDLHTSFYFSLEDEEILPTYKPGQYIALQLQPTGLFQSVIIVGIFVNR